MLMFAPLEFEREGERRGEVVGMAGTGGPPKREAKLARARYKLPHLRRRS